MCVPGATTSGLTRPSVVGPRLEKVARSWALSASALETPQPSVPVGRTFSEAPTEITFLAVPGEVSVSVSLPAEKTCVISWLPDTDASASRVSASNACDALV